MTIQRMDNVLIVVDDLEAAKSFFMEPLSSDAFARTEPSS